MSAALATATARMWHVGTDQQRYWHPHGGAGNRFVLSDFAVAVPVLDRGARTDLEYRVAGRFAGAYFYRGSESRLWFGWLPAGAQFRQDLAGARVSNEIANPFSRFHLPIVLPMCLLRCGLSRGNAGCWSPCGNSTA